jgi:isopentenyl-diphosphate delta-isomerase type 1
MSERVDIVDEQNRVIGSALRSDCHGNPSLIHRAVHVMIFNRAGELLLQLRGKTKKIQPGKWDTSVGGHLSAGETYEEGAKREIEEEMGIQDHALTHMYDYIWRSAVETEYVRTFLMIHDGTFTIQADEIEEARFWSKEEIEASLGQGMFTPNFEEEWRRYLDWQEKTGSGSDK